MAKSKKILAALARATVSRRERKAAKARAHAEAQAERAADRRWAETAPICFGGTPPTGGPHHVAYVMFHTAPMANVGPDHPLWIKAQNFVEVEMAGKLSEFAAPRIRWAQTCVFCTCSLKEREAQNFERVDVVKGEWTKAWAGAVIYRQDGFRVCWVCAGDFKATGVDPMTAPLPEGIETSQAPQKDEPFKVAEWTAGRNRGQAARKVGP